MVFEYSNNGNPIGVSLRLSVHSWTLSLLFTLLPRWSTTPVWLVVLSGRTLLTPSTRWCECTPWQARSASSSTASSFPRLRVWRTPNSAGCLTSSWTMSFRAMTSRLVCAGSPRQLSFSTTGQLFVRFFLFLFPDTSRKMPNISQTRPLSTTSMTIMELSYDTSSVWLLWLRSLFPLTTSLNKRIYLFDHET